MMATTTYSLILQSESMFLQDGLPTLNEVMPFKIDWKETSSGDPRPGVPMSTKLTTNIAFVTVASIIGGIICFAGRSLFKPVLFLTSILLATSFIKLLAYSTFLSTTSEPWVGWVVLTYSILANVYLRLKFVKLAQTGDFVFAGFGGYTVGLQLFDALLMYKTDSNTKLWVFALGIAILNMGTLALYFFDHMLIYSTSLLGSFMFVYSISLVAGHYTSLFTLITLIQHEQLDQIFYAYMAGMIIMFGLGCSLQYKQKYDNKP